MPYKSREKDKLWHRNHMRNMRKLLKAVAKSEVVTPSTSKLVTPEVDVDGNPMYDDRY